MTILLFDKFNFTHIFLNTRKNNTVYPFTLRGYFGIIDNNSFRSALDFEILRVTQIYGYFDFFRKYSASLKFNIIEKGRLIGFQRNTVNHLF